MILEFCRAQGWESVGGGEIRAVQSQLRALRAVADRTSASYVANVLRAAGKIVHYSDTFVDTDMAEPYAQRLKGLLRFDSLEAAETSLRRLYEVYSEYLNKMDRIGTSLVREQVKKGKERARAMAANRKLALAKRREKEEIARWFSIFLETPDILFDWLEVRKNSEEFRKTFGNTTAQPPRDRPLER